MTGRAAIHGHQQRIDAVFARAAALVDDPELLADHAKYLCVLVSGFIEKSLSEVLLEHARRVGAPSLQRFVEANIGRFTNANSEKVLQLLATFDPEWRREIQGVLVDEYRDAFDSVVSLRHRIAHGSSVGVTFVRIKDYYAAIVEVIETIQRTCIPDR